MLAAAEHLDWTPILAAAIPVFLVQVATVVIAILNHRKASDAQDKASEVQDTVQEIHRQTKPSNGETFAKAMERGIEKLTCEVADVRKEQGRFAVELGRHLGEHDQAKRHENWPPGGVT